MAHRRLEALLATGGVTLCGVLAGRPERARALAERFGGAPVFEDVDDMTAARPDAVLVEVPHDVQDAIALAVVGAGAHVLIGGPLATTASAGRALAAAARSRGVVVEAGFEARYKRVWETAKELIAAETLGRLVAADAVALWAADPASWYYDEDASAGMPLTHMTYCFVNPLRWLLGEPDGVMAVANSVVHAGGRFVREETCAALLRFSPGLPVSLVAGYVKSAEHDSWRVTLRGTAATLELLPSETGPGSLRVLRGEAAEARVFAPGEDGFAAQARAFVEAVGGAGACRNTPRDALGDLTVVEAIRRSAREGAFVPISAAPR
ncbi:MAG: Gfo/Idh/MocA family oxidoreductase [Candidatus Eremiobacteraeota bacterium]|nr:Gfo/Idh/MocA family oxidoreductase [Candidatus Eremiobacteraeota bacterium]